MPRSWLCWHSQFIEPRGGGKRRRSSRGRAGVMEVGITHWYHHPHMSLGQRSAVTLLNQTESCLGCMFGVVWREVLLIHNMKPSHSCTTFLLFIIFRVHPDYLENLLHNISVMLNWTDETVWNTAGGNFYSWQQHEHKHSWTLLKLQIKPRSCLGVNNLRASLYTLI